MKTITKAFNITIAEAQYEKLLRLMEEDGMHSRSLYIAYLIGQETKRRQGLLVTETINKNPVGRPRKNKESEEDEQDENDPFNLKQYDDTLYNIKHPWEDFPGQHITERGYHKWMIKQNGINAITGKPYPYDLPTFVERKDYSKEYDDDKKPH